MPPDRSVRRDGVVVDNYAADGPPDSAGTAMLSDGCGGVGSGKNGVSGGSTPSPSPSPFSSGGDGSRDDDNGGQKGGQGDGKATAGRRRGDGDAKAIEYGTSAGELIELTGRNRPEGAMLPTDGDPL
jgi:hypothetical protein